jgi:hypothetical protein
VLAPPFILIEPPTSWSLVPALKFILPVLLTEDVPVEICMLPEAPVSPLPDTKFSDPLPPLEPPAPVSIVIAPLFETALVPEDKLTLPPVCVSPLPALTVISPPVVCPCPADTDTLPPAPADEAPAIALIEDALALLVDPECNSILPTDCTALPVAKTISPLEETSPLPVFNETAPDAGPAFDEIKTAPLADA